LCEGFLIIMGRLNQNIETKKYITSEEVFQSTNGGLDVFRREIPDFTTTANVRNVLVDKDRNPSSRIKQSSTSGLWLFKVYNAGGGCYNAIQFIQKRYNLNFKEAIEYIVNQHQLTPVIEHKPIKIIKKEPIFYEVETMPFTKQHTDYYCIGGLTEEFLNKEMDIWAVKLWAVNKNVKKVDEDKFMFVYKFRDENGNLVPGKMKFLTLGKNVDKKDKWKTNVDNSKLWYLYKLKGNEPLICITKSVKDTACLWNLGIPSIAVQSENAQILSNNIPFLKEKYPKSKFCILFGADPQGVEESIKLTTEHNLDYFNTPKRLLNNLINDPYSYILQFGEKSFLKIFENKFGKINLVK
jgi:hypothetical protein